MFAKPKSKLYSSILCFLFFWKFYSFHSDIWVIGSCTWLEVRSNTIALPTGIHFPLHHLWKGLMLLLFLGILTQHHLTTYVRVSSLSSPASCIDLFACLSLCFNYWSKPQIRKYDFFNFDLSKVCFEFSRSFDAPYEFKNRFFYF